MRELKAYVSSDWHVGIKDKKHEFPTKREIKKSLEKARRERAFYIFAGDLVNKCSEEALRDMSKILAREIARGLLFIAIEGNHDTTHDDRHVVKDELKRIGATVLTADNPSVVVRSGVKEVTVIGVSGEVGHAYDQWWKGGGVGKKEARKRAYLAATPYRDSLKRGLEGSQTHNTVVVTHRSIISETIGTYAKRQRWRYASTLGFAEIIDSHKRRSGRDIQVITGHDHGNSPWEGAPYGKTRGGIEVQNVAAPVRRRKGLPFTTILTF